MGSIMFSPENGVREMVFTSTFQKHFGEGPEWVNRRMRFVLYTSFLIQNVGNRSQKKWLKLRSTPHPVTVTTRIITFLVGNPHKPSFATVTGWGVDPS